MTVPDSALPAWFTTRSPITLGGVRSGPTPPKALLLRSGRVLSAFFLCCLALGVPCQGQSEQQGEEKKPEQQEIDKPVPPPHETVYVTARRREEDVQRVPQSVTVLDPVQLRIAKTDTLDELTFIAPNVNFLQARSSSSNGSLFIRGIGQEDTVFTVDSGVGLYVDDILLPRSQGALIDLFDLERIEVLRGPQGTLYGRNTIAGAVRLITRRPTEKRSADLEFSTGNYDRVDFKGAFNVPIVPGKLLSRLVFATYNRDGFEFNSFTGQRTDSKSSLAGRGTFFFLPSETFRVEFRVDGLRERPSIHVGALLRPQVTALDFPGLVAGNLVNIPVSDDPFRVRANTEDKLDLNTWGVSGTLFWNWDGPFSLKTISSYRNLFSDGRIDFDATEARGADVFLIQHHDQASQEILLTHDGGRAVTVGGFFFLFEDDNQFDGTDATAKGFSIDSEYSQTVHSYAVFGQTTRHLTERLSVTGGLRYTYETKRFSRRSELHVANLNAPDSNLFGGFGRGPGGRPPARFPGNGRPLTNIRDAQRDWSAVTPRIGVEFQWSPNAMIFSSLARGFKSGGFNGRATESSNPRQRDPYEPEYVWTYEVGAKTAWFDRNLLVNATAFYNDYTDLQLASFVGADTDGDGLDDTFLPLFTNAGRAVTQGLELELNALPWPGMEVALSAGYTDATFKEYIERGKDVSRSRSLPNSPRWTGNLSGRYTVPLANSGSVLELKADAGYQGERYLTVSNLPDLLQGSYVVANASASLLVGNSHWRFTLGVRNLSDERYLVSGLDGSTPPFGIVTGFYGDPRTWFLSIAKSF